MSKLPLPCEASGIRRYTALGKATPGCLIMTLGQPHLPTPKPVLQALEQALQQGMTGYSPNRGEPCLIDAVCDYENRQGIPCSGENILITQGATGGLFSCFTALLSAGDQVIINAPYYPLYATLAQLSGAAAVYADSAGCGYGLSALCQAITPKTRMVVLNAPCNPTGAMYDAPALQTLVETIGEREIFVLCDTAYRGLSDFPFAEQVLYPLGHRLLLCRSFSKTWAMTGFRCGWLVAQEQIISRLTAYQAAQISCIPPFIQKACCAALTLQPVCRYHRQRQYGSYRLQQMGPSHPTPRGGFYLLPDIAKYGVDDNAFCQAMIEKGGVAAVPGSVFGAAGHIRLSCCCHMDTLSLALDRFEQFLQKL